MTAAAEDCLSNSRRTSPLVTRGDAKIDYTRVRDITGFPVTSRHHCMRWNFLLSRALILLENQGANSAPFSRPIKRELTRRQMECVMDWNRIEGNWKQFKGRAKEKWGRLTDDDLDVINGRQDQLEGKIQERYGFAKDQAKKDVNDWFSSLS
jgi:uncharacterized protein YjbJ (UPF0337 family)